MTLSLLNQGPATRRSHFSRDGTAQGESPSNSLFDLSKNYDVGPQRRHDDHERRVSRRWLPGNLFYFPSPFSSLTVPREYGTVFIMQQ